MTDTNEMITAIYNKLIKPKNNSEKVPKRMSLRQYFINCYVKEGVYEELTPFEMIQGDIDQVRNLAAQITFKLLTPDDKASIKETYKLMSDEDLEHLKNN